MRWLAAVRLGALAFVAFASTHCLGEDLNTNPDPGPDAGASSLLVGGDMEAPNCRGWTTNEAVVATQPSGHAGASACKVCGAPGVAGVWNIFQTLPGAGGNYTAEAWVRALDRDSPPKVFLELAVIDAASGNPTSDPFASQTLLDDVWRRVSVSGTVPAGREFNVALVARDPGTCFLVDDVVLRKDP